MRPLSNQRVHIIIVVFSQFENPLIHSVTNLYIHCKHKHPIPTLKPFVALIWTSFRHQNQASEAR